MAVHKAEPGGCEVPFEGQQDQNAVLIQVGTFVDMLTGMDCSCPFSRFPTKLSLSAS